MRIPGRTAALALAMTMTIGTGAQAVAAPQAANVPNQLPLAKPKVPAAKSATFKRTTENLRLRQRASTASATLLVIPQGTKVRVLGTSRGWDKVEYGGKTGWSSADYLQKLSSAPEAKTGTVRYTTANLNLRVGAGTSHRSLGVIPKGEKVTVLQTSNGWAKLKSSKGTGWSSAAYLGTKAATPQKKQEGTKESTGSTSFTTANLNLRIGAGISYRSIGVIPKGEKVSVLRTSGHWAQVKSSKGTGWVSRAYLGADTAPSKPRSPQPKAPQKQSSTAYTTANLNLRAGAGVSHRSLGVIPQGEKVIVLDTSGGWSKIRSSKGTGWSSSDYLSSRAPKANPPKAKEETKPTPPKLTQPKTPEQNPQKETTEGNIAPTGGSSQWTTANLNLRAGASTSHRSLGIIPQGEKLTVHLTTNGWSKVSSSVGTGYVSAAFLSDEKPSTIQYRWTTGSLNLRTGPGTSYASKGAIPAYERVQLLNLQDGWAEVVSSLGTGYVSSRYLTTAELHAVRSDTQRVMEQMRQLFSGDFTSLGTVRAGSVGHSSGRAVDVMITGYKTEAGIAAGDRISQFLLDNRRQLGVSYLIWQDKIWLSEATGWEPYSESGKYGTQFTNNWNDTTLHLDHIHVETHGEAGTGGALDYSALN